MKLFTLCLFFVSSLCLAGESEGHRQAEAICKYIGGADSIIRCNRAVNEAKTLQPEAVQICKYIGGADKIIECLQAIKNKNFSESAVSTCKYIGGAEKIIECLKASGTETKPAKADDDDKKTSSRDLIKKAIKQMDAGNYGKAKETLQKALERDND